MAKAPEKVATFLDELAAKLQPIWLKEKEELLQLKKDEVTNKYVPSSNHSDFAFTAFLPAAIADRSTNCRPCCCWGGKVGKSGKSQYFTT